MIRGLYFRKHSSQANAEYNKILIGAHLGWWGTVIFVTLRATNVIPQSFGTVSLLTLGLGVTASLSLSRMRLGKTITEVFNAGMKAAITLSANVFTDTCIMALDEDGVIQSVDHADAIGWETEGILGKCLVVDLLAPRSGMPGKVRKLEPGTSIASPMKNQDGDVFDARISLALLDQGHDGDGTHPTLVATVSPVVSSHSRYNLESE